MTIGWLWRMQGTGDDDYADVRAGTAEDAAARAAEIYDAIGALQRRADGVVIEIFDTSTGDATRWRVRAEQAVNYYATKIRDGEEGKS